MRRQVIKRLPPRGMASTAFTIMLTKTSRTLDALPYVKCPLSLSSLTSLFKPANTCFVLPTSSGYLGRIMQQASDISASIARQSRDSRSTQRRPDGGEVAASRDECTRSDAIEDLSCVALAVVGRLSSDPRALAHTSSCVFLAPSWRSSVVGASSLWCR